MNCSCFKRQTADWLDRRLSLDHTEEMTSHREGCEPCARAALAESQLRQSWRETSAATPVVDVWPRLLTRLEAQEPSMPRLIPRQVFRLPHWAVGGAVLLAAMSVFGLRQPLLDRAGLGQHGNAVPIPAAPAPGSEAVASSGHAKAWLELGDVAQVDPFVNDPLGANMETVWSNIKTSGK